jgi:hypothetical protein
MIALKVNHFSPALLVEVDSQKYAQIMLPALISLRGPCVEKGDTRNASFLLSIDYLKSINFPRYSLDISTMNRAGSHEIPQASNHFGVQFVWAQQP